MTEAMDDIQKDRLFRYAFWGAVLLYVWVLAMLWIGPEWGLSGTTYFLVAILPAGAGVVSLAAAMGIYMDLHKDDS